ncbi:MAG: mechanosensitive ion channel family protein [Candidatus Diapherotrites archaeon]|nr:mechanosensitive ion channel family protein [Candidatus Diapherotrites archaeon]
MPDSGIFIGSVSLANLLIFIFVFIVTLAVGNAANASLRKFLDAKVSKRTSKVAARALQYAVFVLGMYIGVYYILGLDLTALAASLGILSIAVAFSSQQLIQNIIAGVLIAIQRPVQIEDWVEVGNSGVGRVSDIKLTYTMLKDVNGRVVYIPNSVVLGSSIVNYTESGFVGINVPLQVPPGIDIDMMKKALLEAVNIHPLILPNISNGEKRSIMRLFKLPNKRFFSKPPDLEKFKPQVLFTGMTGVDTLLAVKIWIAEISKKERIVSDLLGAARSILKEEKKEKYQRKLSG